MTIRRHVFKYQIPAAEHPTELVMPAGAKIVHVGSQQPGTVTIWAESEENYKPVGLLEARLFLTIPTGVDFTETDAQYVGTAPHVTGLPPRSTESFVLHLYEIPSETSTP